MFFKIILSWVIFAAFSAQADDFKRLRFRLYSDPPTLDWHLCYTDGCFVITNNIMEGLFDLDEKLKIVPVLVKFWKVSPDGRTYEFRIKDNVTWTDGKPLTADDFVFSWKRLLTPETAAPGVVSFRAVIGAQDFLEGKLKDFQKVGIKAKDSKTIQVKLKSRWNGWESVLASPATFPMRRDVVDRFGNDWTKPGNIQTLGPYVLTKVETQKRILLKANPTYYGKTPTIQEAEAIIVESGQTAITLFQARQLDVVTTLSHFDTAPFKGTPLLRNYPSMIVHHMGFVLNKYPMTNKHFRRAVSMAIDKTGFQKIMGPSSRPAESFVPPQISGSTLRKPIFDPEKAKMEFQKSGVPLDSKVKILVGSISSGTGHPVAEYIQQQLKLNLGFQVDIDLLGLQPAREARVKHTSQLYITGFFPDFADAYAYFEYFLNPSGFTLWQNDSFRKLIDRAQSSVSLSERRHLLAQAEEILMDEMPAVPLYYPDYLVLVAQHIEPKFSPFGELKLKDTILKTD